MELGDRREVVGAADAVPVALASVESTRLCSTLWFCARLTPSRAHLQNDGTADAVDAAFRLLGTKNTSYGLDTIPPDGL